MPAVRIHFDLNAMWGKDLSYLTGVYFGDGSISKDSRRETYTYGVLAVDKPFVDYCATCIKNVFGVERPVELKSNKTSAGNSIYVVRVGATEFGSWLLEASGQKARIPQIVWESPLDIRLAFLAGYFDSDGTMCKRGSPKIAGVYPFGEEMAALFVYSGIRAWRHNGYTSGSGRYVWEYGLSVYDMLTVGFKPVLERKQPRQPRYREQRNPQRLYVGVPSWVQDIGRPCMKMQDASGTETTCALA